MWILCKLLKITFDVNIIQLGSCYLECQSLWQRELRPSGSFASSCMFSRTTDGCFSFFLSFFLLVIGCVCVGGTLPLQTRQLYLQLPPSPLRAKSKIQPEDSASSILSRCQVHKVQSAWKYFYTSAKPFEIERNLFCKKFPFFLTFLEFYILTLFYRTSVFSVAPLIPLFWTSGNVCPGFQRQGPRVDPSLVCFVACTQWIP